MASTYEIKFVVNIEGKEYRKEATFISSADNIPDAIDRFKRQLPAAYRKTFALVQCIVKRTNGLRFTTTDYDRKFAGRQTPTNWPKISPATRRPDKPRFPDVWRLVDVGETKWQEDPCGISVIINWVLPADVVRIDLIGMDSIPIISFQGRTDDVRKHCLRWLSRRVPELTLDHAGYIGAELEKADTERIDYVQDGKVVAKTKTKTILAERAWIDACERDLL